MLWHITKRELQDHFSSLRFALTLGLTTLLMVLNAVLFIRGDYTQKLKEYSDRTAEVAEAVRGYAEHLNDLAEKGPHDLYKKPSSCVFAAKGQEDILPVRIQARSSEGFGGSFKMRYMFDWPWKLEYVQDTYREHSILRPSIALDWSFIIGVVMSFVAVLFSFDAISRERERGTLPLALSNPIPRGVFLLGKFFGALIAIAVPLLIGILLNVLIILLSGVISFGGELWGRLGLMAAASLIYVGIFIGIGLAVSSWVRNSSTSLLVLLVVWVGFAVLVPNALGSLIGTLKPVPDNGEQEWAVLGELLEQTKDLDYMFEYGSPTNRHTEEPPRREALERWANLITKGAEAQSHFEDEHLHQQFAQAEFARGMLRISPTVIYYSAMEALAGTGFQRHKQFVEAAQRYREQFITFIKDRDAADPESPHVYYIREGLSSKPVSYNEIPQFEEPSGVGVAMHTALFDASVLILLALLAFMLSYLMFLRCEIR